MKILFVLMMFASSFCFAASADYSCQIRNYRVDFFLIRTTSSTIWLQDQNSYEMISQGFVSWIEDKGAKTIFHYRGSAGGKLDLIFQTQDTLNFPQQMYVWIDTTANGFTLWDRMLCSKTP